MQQDKKIETLRKENKQVLEFIKVWQSKNEYNPIALDEYNAKFKKEFEHYLNNSNLSKETIESYKN